MTVPTEPHPPDHRPADDRPPDPGQQHADGRPTGPARTRGRRAGYAGSVVVNLILLWLINGWPGWDAVPFLTASTVLVIGAVNASIIARIVADAVNLVLDLPRVRALGDIVSIGFGLFALLRIWQVFPLDVTDGWEILARIVLVVGFVGSAIGIVEALSRLVTGRFPRM
ncbi:MAG TPA: hypothetical protein VFP73_10735 [Terrabacter sp.]|nr:hypothetical protein [Terrabacter sp.]